MERGQGLGRPRKELIKAGECFLRRSVKQHASRSTLGLTPGRAHPANEKVVHAAKMLRIGVSGNSILEISTQRQSIKQQLKVIAVFLHRLFEPNQGIVRGAVAQVVRLPVDQVVAFPMDKDHVDRAPQKTLDLPESKWRDRVVQRPQRVLHLMRRNARGRKTKPELVQPLGCAQLRKQDSLGKRGLDKIAEHLFNHPNPVVTPLSQSLLGVIARSLEPSHGGLSLLRILRGWMFEERLHNHFIGHCASRKVRDLGLRLLDPQADEFLPGYRLPANVRAALRLLCARSPEPPEPREVEVARLLRASGIRALYGL